MRGQVSLEYLMLTLVALSMLSVSAMALLRLRGSAELGAQAMSFRLESAALRDSISEVCALGDGNGRTVRLSAPIAVESADAQDGWVVRVSRGALSAAFESRCEASGGGEKEIYVKNEEGSVSVRGR